MQNYVAAYNKFDVDGMAVLVHPEVVLKTLWRRDRRRYRRLGRVRLFLASGQRSDRRDGQPA